MPSVLERDRRGDQHDLRLIFILKSDMNQRVEGGRAGLVEQLEQLEQLIYLSQAVFVDYFFVDFTV